MAPRKQKTPAVPPIYQIRATWQHETCKGLFATTPLTPGTLIHSEGPLIHCPITIMTYPQTSTREVLLTTHISTRLTATQRKSLTKYYSHPNKLWTSDTQEATPLQSVVCGSGIPLSIRPDTPGFRMVGVFPVLSKLNHACVPNCHLVYTETTNDNGDTVRTARLYALNDIQAGQQLTISYVPNAAIDQAYLEDTFGFVCVCKTWCLRPKAFRDQYMKKLRVLDVLRGQLLDLAERGSVLEKGYQAIKLMHQLGISDFRLASVYRALFEVMVVKDEESKAQFFAVHAFLAWERCEGRESVSVAELVGRVNVVWGLGDEEGIDVQATFLKLVQDVREKTTAFLGFVDDQHRVGEVFTEKTLEERFEKSSWEGDAEVVLSDDDEGLFVEEDDPISRVQVVAPRSSTSKRESHRAKSDPSEKKNKKTASAEKKKKKQEPKRTLPPVPLFPKAAAAAATPTKKGGGRVDKRRRVSVDLTASPEVDDGEKDGGVIDLTGSRYDDDEEEEEKEY